MNGIVRAIGHGASLLGAAALLLMGLQITVDVLGRNLAGQAIPATADLVGKYYMVAVSFVPLALTQIHRRHIEATIFTDRMSGAPRRIVGVLGVAIAIAVFALMTWGTALEAIKNTARRSYVEAGLIHVPTWPSYWILPLSFALMVLVLALQLPAALSGHAPATPPAQTEVG